MRRHRIRRQQANSIRISRQRLKSRDGKSGRVPKLPPTPESRDRHRIPSPGFSILPPRSRWWAEASPWRKLPDCGRAVGGVARSRGPPRRSPERTPAELRLRSFLYRQLRRSSRQRNPGPTVPVIVDHRFLADLLAPHNKSGRTKWPQARDRAYDAIGRDTNSRERRLRRHGRGLLTKGPRVAAQPVSSVLVAPRKSRREIRILARDNGRSCV